LPDFPAWNNICLQRFVFFTGFNALDMVLIGIHKSVWIAKNIGRNNRNEGDNMLKNIMWQMFEKTGNIEYFMQYRDVKKPDFLTEAGTETALDGEQWRISKREEWSSGK
jgi:hypothetical protein